MLPVASIMVTVPVGSVPSACRQRHGGVVAIRSALGTSPLGAVVRQALPIMWRTRASPAASRPRRSRSSWSTIRPRHQQVAILPPATAGAVPEAKFEAAFAWTARAGPEPSGGPACPQIWPLAAQSAPGCIRVATWTAMPDSLARREDGPRGALPAARAIGDYGAATGAGGRPRSATRARASVARHSVVAVPRS